MKKALTSITISDGRTVKTRDVSLFMLIKSGRLPNPLLPYVRAGITGETVNPEDFSKKLKDDKDIKDYIEFFVEYAKLAVVEPRLTEEPVAGEGEISLWDLSDNDFVLIFAHSQFARRAEEGAQLQQFPEGQE